LYSIINSPLHVLPARWPENPQGNVGNDPSLIKLERVVKKFHTPAGEFTALKEVSLNISRGEFTAIVGKSGSGKSTMINMITGIDHPDAGQVFIDAIDIHKMNEDELSRWRGRYIGIVFQFFQLIPNLTLLENILLPIDLLNQAPHKQRVKRASFLLEMVGLLENKDKKPAEVSGGQQQRAAIARALANDPPVLITDEPTGNLDSQSAAVVFDIFRSLAASGKTILMVTHDNELALKAQRIVEISDGRICRS